jgi:putative Mn2+ efflux pump MntP
LAIVKTDIAIGLYIITIGLYTFVLNTFGVSVFSRQGDAVRAAPGAPMEIEYQ